MGNFVNAMEKEELKRDNETVTENNSNVTVTENGAYAYKSTTNSLLDLFGTIGALRERSADEIEELFKKALDVNALGAVKMSFYARDIRAGLGERRTAKIIWKWLADNYPETMYRNLALVPHFGRWDDLYAFVGTKVEDGMWALMCRQWNDDVKNAKDGKPISLMAKWLKSVNASDEESRRLGRLTAKKMGFSERTYRKALSTLRKYLDVTEVKMSNKDFGNIQYANVPSKAMNNYRKAFERNDEGRFRDYLESVKKGESKINASTLYPYDIMMKYGVGKNYWYYEDYDDTLELQWKNLPNYIEGENNVLVMADTSGSMFGRPLATSMGLAIYFAERNHGEFKNKFMTFDVKPHFITLKGKSLRDKLDDFKSINANTNLMAALEMILNVAVANSVSKEDMPKALVIISDMEFDKAVTTRDFNWENNKWSVDSTYDVSYNERIKKMFTDEGYDVPKIVFWNVNSRHDVFHTMEDEGMKNVVLVSGQSVSTFKMLLANIEGNAEDVMWNVLNGERYGSVVL